MIARPVGDRPAGGVGFFARAAVRLLPGVALVSLLAVAAFAQHGSDSTGYEAFAEVDPYTKGDRELSEQLGYLHYGPFQWFGAEGTPDVAQTMGGIDVLWVETEHFKLGSSLGTYAIPNDRDERKLLAAELKRLKKRIGRLKAPKKKLDPWLRLHLYAQRLEELYRDYSDRFGFEPQDFDEGHPYFGQPKKFLVLLCERKSSWGRYARHYMEVENDHSYRYSVAQGGFFFGINAEVLRERGYASDTALWCAVAGGVVSNFVDGHRYNDYEAPTWWRCGLSHWYSRRVDPRFTIGIGYKPDDAVGDEDWNWEPRVYKLVSNEFFPSSEKMFGWRRYEELDTFAHLIVWSRADFLIRRAEDGDGDLGAFHDAICRPAPEETESEEGLLALQLERQNTALAEHFGLTPSELDAAWAKLVKRRYARK